MDLCEVELLVERLEKYKKDLEKSGSNAGYPHGF
jgi:hypothetical protein